MGESPELELDLDELDEETEDVDGERDLEIGNTLENGDLDLDVGKAAPDRFGGLCRRPLDSGLIPLEQRI